MNNSEQPGVDELLHRLQAAGKSEKQGPDEEYTESCPVLSERFAGMKEAQQHRTEDLNPDLSVTAGLSAADREEAAEQDGFDDPIGRIHYKKPGLISRLAERLTRLTDPLNHEPDNDGAEVANWPKQIHIGFMAQVKKRDLLFHIGEWVTDNASSKASCFYQITPYSGGFAYEIQEGGSGQGVLKSALETLGRHSEVIIPSSERYLQLSIKQPGFSSYLLDEDDSRLPSPELTFKDQLKPVFSRHHGLMTAGILSALLGLAAIGSSWFMVYAIYNKDKVPVYAKTRYELPSEQLRKVNDILNQGNSYLQRLEFKADRWNLVVKQTDPDPASEPDRSAAHDEDNGLREIRNTLKEAVQ